MFLFIRLQNVLHCQISARMPMITVYPVTDTIYITCKTNIAGQLCVKIVCMLLGSVNNSVFRSTACSHKQSRIKCRQFVSNRTRSVEHLIRYDRVEILYLLRICLIRLLNVPF